METGVKVHRETVTIPLSVSALHGTLWLPDDVAEVSTVIYSPSDAGVSAVGHHGFFRPKIGRQLWPHLSEWLTDRANEGGPL